jgi:hypothetical protein
MENKDSYNKATTTTTKNYTSFPVELLTRNAAILISINTAITGIACKYYLNLAGVSSTLQTSICAGPYGDWSSVPALRFWVYNSPQAVNGSIVGSSNIMTMYPGFTIGQY